MMKPRFCIWIVSPPNYPHSRCFEEVALGLRAGFAALGFDAPIVTQPIAADHIITLGANLLPRMPAPLPDNLILYNLEQITPGSPWLKPEYLALLARFPVWDYSPLNIRNLAALGVHSAQLCGIGYAPELTRITPSPEEDIDVLFIGSMNERRRHVLDSIAAKGFKVIGLFNQYGAERDAHIARAKIVLNLHYYEAQVFEIVRVSYLLANRTCVVSETGNDAELEAPLSSGVAFAPYAQLVDICVGLLQDDARRNAYKQEGFTCFSRMPQRDKLKQVLDSMEG